MMLNISFDTCTNIMILDASYVHYLIMDLYRICQLIYIYMSIINLFKIRSTHLLPILYRLFTSRRVGDKKTFLLGSRQGST